jgi:nucleoid DNA-binding protein
MNKRQLIAAAAARTSLTQRQVREALDAILETIADSLASSEPVTLSSFGRFDVKYYAPRRLRRFDGPGHYIVRDRSIPVFRSSAALRRRLREAS